MVDFNLDPTLMVRLTQESPIDAFARGVQTIQGIGQNAMSMKRQQMQMQQMQGEQQALKQFAQNPTDVKPLMPYMTPAQAVQAPYAIPEQKMKMAENVLNYWDKTKGTVTRENYPQVRNDFAKQFPDVASHFPPPESFKTDQDFEKWKYNAEMKAYELKNALTPWQKIQADLKQQHEDTYRASAGSQAEHRGVMEGQGEERIGIAARRQAFQETKPVRPLSESQMSAKIKSDYTAAKDYINKKYPEGPQKKEQLDNLDKAYNEKIKPFTKPGKGAKEVAPDRLNHNLQLDKDAAGAQ